MDDVLNAARSDLAFLKAVAEDRGTLPALMGWHLVAIGAVFGLDFIHIWAIFSGYASWPEWLLWGTCLPGLAVYVPANAYINYKAGQTAWGPGARMFGTAWAAMAIMIPPALLVLYLGQLQTGLPFYLVWPALAFVLYGGAWSVIAVVRRSPTYFGIAVACFATAALCALLIGQAAQWLVMATALGAFVALPGLWIVHRAKGVR